MNVVNHCLSREELERMGAITERDRRMTCWVGDITQLDVDAIVNAANERMLGGGGVDGAIHRAAGPQLLEACRAVPEVSPGVRCPTGEARITPGFELSATHVIHTVGPIWGWRGNEAEQLGACYRNSLALACEYGLTAIAFPAISTGVYGFPKELAAITAVQEVRAFLAQHESPRRVIFVAFNAEDLSHYTEAFKVLGVV